MKIQKTIKARIVSLTKRKEELLEREYTNWQNTLQGWASPLYSATKQQAERLAKRLGKRMNDIDYPMVLRNDVINIQRHDTQIAHYWMKVPIHGIRGGIKVPLQLPQNQEGLLSLPIKESKLIWKRDHWSVHIVVEKEVASNTSFSYPIIAVDFGERHIATSVEWDGVSMKNPKFYGTEVRGIRRHYAWLRMRLGERKCLRTIKKVGNSEQRKVDAVLHNISRQIVDRAKEIGATIVLGSPNGKSMRRSAKGRRFRRIVYSMPYYRLTQFITYKASWDSVPVVLKNEDFSSKECHVCHEWMKRPQQDLVICQRHGHYNADLNAGINLAKRFCDHWLQDGAAFDTALNFGAMR